MPTTHIIGAGLAGLAAALKLTAAGRDVQVHESSGQAGGRCRSFFSDRLERTIDNGNHLILGANTSALEYIRMIGATERFIRVFPPKFPFVDMATHETWMIHPARMFPFGPWKREVRIPATRPRDYLETLFYAFAGPANTVTGTYRGGPGFYRRFIGPLCFAALNTHPREASAQMLWRVVRDAFLKDKNASAAWIARESLSACLIDPAIEKIRSAGGRMEFHNLLRNLHGEGRVTMLEFSGDDTRALTTGDTVILAVPPWNAAELLPDAKIPQLPSPIVNAHYHCPELVEHMTSRGLPFMGVAGGIIHWLFFRDGIVSVTVSAAEGLVDQPSDIVAGVLWQEIRKLYNMRETVPPCHVIKEKRATLKATPIVDKLRPPMQTPFANCFLAGDYVQTGLPCTIDSAVQSGFAAAQRILESF